MLFAEAKDYFNPALIEQFREGDRVTDLSAFENGGQLPGSYLVDIYLNDERVDSREIRFLTSADKGLQPCLGPDELAKYGIRIAHFANMSSEGDSCSALSAIPDASAQYIFNAQRLNLSVPQAAVIPRVRGYVPPDQWDEGINAALLNYSFSGIADLANHHGDSSDSQYLNLRPGLNMGAWRIRNYTTLSRRSGADDKWNTIYNYAQRSIIPLKSQLTLGESLSPSDVFDSVPYRGAQVSSDDDMLPESLRGYAPVVRGIARSTNAQITIRQNGYIIYQATLPAGPFEITDLFPGGGSGDLYVTVKESDGSEQHSLVPFASLPVLLREGRLRFSLTGGQYRPSQNSVEKSTFGQGSAIFGLGNGMTLYGGVQSATHYRSLAAGLGQNLGPLGAFSFDLTQSWGQPKYADFAQGQSLRIRYSKSMVETGTHLAIAGYRYSTAGFYHLVDVLQTYRDNPNAAPDSRKRHRAELTLSQNIGTERGYLTAGAINESYWGGGRKTASWNLGYSNSWDSISYSFNYTSSRITALDGTQGVYYRNSNEYNRVLSMNISISLHRWLNNTYASYSLSSSKSRDSVNTIGLSGAALQDNSLNWNVSQGHAAGGQGSSGSASVNYRDTYAEVNGGYSYGTGQRSINYGIQGTVVAHANGVTAGLPVGETAGLVKAPGAAGVGVNNQNGVKTDYRGYTLVPNLMPYRPNDLTLNTETLKDNVELQQSSRTVIPTRGALVRADYRVQIGQRVFMTLTRADGRAVPFGATVVSETDPDAGGSIVGEAGQVYLAGLQNKGVLRVQWGKGAAHQCRVHYRLKDEKNNADIQSINSSCR
ncbi:fimbria/pilus outer membrane usher protein [Erwinia tasmaniensis]|uniref:fimbria/pilus outer membrane usher protein n=1 Tax=Erwinia tasmaniensis TaxID=338565 RepID=UPI003A4E58C5